MAVDTRAFRQTVGQFVTGVTVITTEVEGEVRGMTANAFTSLSLDPPLVLFCVGKHTHMATFIGSASVFSVNILRLDQAPLSNYFAGLWKEEVPPPFSFTEWEGGPRLDRCVAAIGCALHAIHEGGDHWIVIGRVLSLYRSEDAGAPLVYRGGRYTSLNEEVNT